ncbi:MAG: cell division inhibitor SulA [Pseudomonas sp.]|jgi:cell division inhibitor SulA
MQLPQALDQAQLPLFEAFLAQPMSATAIDSAELSWTEETDAVSELTLRGASTHCLNLLAPILRELSQNQDARWLTLIAPPNSLTRTWLRDAGLNRERILLLHPHGKQSARDLACSALRLGRSHTVVSWLQPLDRLTQQLLVCAANAGSTQSLNINQK